MIFFKYFIMLLTKTFLAKKYLIFFLKVLGYLIFIFKGRIFNCKSGVIFLYNGGVTGVTIQIQKLMIVVSSHYSIDFNTAR